jgi:localization factor PodJL
MKSGTPWSSRGIDEETRKAIREAARRAGLSVSEWLNNQAAEDEVSPDPDDASRIAAALDRLTVRLRNMDAASRASVPQLAGRLDQIEQHLGSLPANDQTGERGRRLRGVSAMVEQLARDIDNADERARSMVEGLRGARPASGNASRVTEAIRELDQRIAAMGNQINAPPAPDQPPRLDDIRYQLNALLARTPKPARVEPEPSRAAGIDAALRALEARIDQAKANLVQPRSPVAEVEQLARIEEQLAAIGSHLSRPAETASTAPRRDADLASAIAEISAHQRSLDERAEVLAMRRDQKALSAAMAALRADIAALTEQVVAIGRNGAEDQGATFDLARRIDALSAAAPVDRNLLASIRHDLEALNGLIGDEKGKGALGAIDERIGAVASRLDEINRRTPDRSRLDALGEEVSALRRTLESDDSPRAIQRLEMRLSELGRNLEAVLSGRNTPVANPAIERIEDRLEALGQNIAATLARPVAESPLAGRIEGRLDEIATRIDSLLDRVPGTAELADVRERLNSLAQSVEGLRRTQQQPAATLDEIAARIDSLLDRSPAADEMAGMQERLNHLADSIEGLSRAQRQPAAALDEIKNEIVAIRRDIGGRAPPDTAHLEDQIRELADRLETATASDAGNAGLADLETQVASLAAQLEGQPRAHERRQVPENLDRLQAHLKENRRESIDAARAEARAAVDELAAMRAPPADSDLIRALRRDLDTLRNAADDTSTRTSSTIASVTETLSHVADRLGRLEKETTRPARPAAVPQRPETPAAQAAQRAAAVVETQSEKKSADRRADFIAAARRAAQAAAAEAARVEPAPTDEPAEPRERKPGAFARISQAIRSRRRPLLLAAAAIVLAIGAMQLYGRFTGAAGSPDDNLIAETARPAPIAAASNPPTTSGIALSVPSPASGAMVAPSTTPDASIAFAAPEAFGARFSGGAPEAAANPAPLPATPAVAPQAAAKPAPLTLASAPAAAGLPIAMPPAAEMPANAPDTRIGSDKLVRAAAAGDSAAAFEVAARYADGNRVPKNLAKAAEWYEKAANGGIAVAQYRLGSLNERGQGVAKNLAKAVIWYQRAADQGNINAMHNLAVLMSEGADGPPDPEKALQWFLAAGDYGVRDSQYNLGVIYARGLGTAQNLQASYKWFAIAASQGDTDAGARRDEVAKLLNGDDLAKARAAVQAWHAKPPLAEANGVSAPDGGWDSAGEALGEADRQALVKKIQVLLAGQGFDPGPADGRVGQKTRDAVRAYQRKNGIAETGQIDNKVIASLTDRTM